MGQMHFHVPEAATDFFDACDWKDAYLCGIEGVPWQTRNTFTPLEGASAAGGRFTLNRAVDTSAKLLLTCPVEGIGYRLLTTCSLRCLPESHRLLIELARGSCYRVRLQSDTWQRGGLSLSDRFTSLLEEGTRHFLNAAQQFTPASGEADQVLGEADVTTHAIAAITLLEQAASELGDLFAKQSLAFRQTRESKLSTMLAGGLVPCEDESLGEDSPGAASLDPESPSTEGAESIPIHSVFNAAAVRISWGDIENETGQSHFAPTHQALQQCADAGIRVIGGPIVDHHEGMLPDWLTYLDDDFEKVMSSMTQFVEATVNEFRGRVHLWNAASGLNTAGPLGLDDEQVMRFAIGILQTIRRCDPNTPVVMSIDQPCGEYLAKDANGISPLHFADALLRSGLGLAGIGLNFRFGYQAGSTHPRSSLEFAQLIDRWATLNAPLLVQLSVVGAPGKDSLARLHAEVQSLKPEIALPSANGHVQSSGENPKATSGSDSLDAGQIDLAAWANAQCEFARPLVQTLLAKQIVHAIVWDGWDDRRVHITPHSGIIDASGKPRPILRYFQKLRSDVLM